MADYRTEHEDEGGGEAPAQKEPASQPAEIEFEKSPELHDQEHGVENVPELNIQEDRMQGVVSEGLHLKAKGDTGKLLCSVSYYPYCKPEVLSKPEWMTFVDEDLEGPHIMLCKMQKGTRVADALPVFQHSRCVVAVVINCEDSYHLTPEQLHEITVGDIPFIVVPASEGKKLNDILENSEVGDVLVKIEIESGVDSAVNVQQLQPMMERHPTEHDSQTESPSRQSSYVSGSLSGLSSGYKINWLQDVLQRYLFEDGNPTQISSAQPQYFVMIISAFENYVKEVKARKSRDIRGGVSVLISHMDRMFEENFPFYIAVAYYIHLKRTDFMISASVVLDEFISKCIKQLEEMDTQKLATALTAFIDRANTQDDQSMQYLKQFVDACQCFIGYSPAVTSSIHSRPIYHRIMWTTIVVACSQKSKDHTNVDSIWNSNVVTHCVRYKDLARVKDLEDGIKLMKLMHFSPVQMISNDGLAICLLPEEGKTVLSFRRLGDFVWKIRESITSEAYFQVLIASLRVKYDGILKAGTRHTAFSSLTTSQKPNLLEGTFLECIIFLNALIETWEHNKWESELMDAECWKWFELLLRNLKVYEGTHRPLMALLVRTQHKSTKKYRKQIKKHVWEATRSARLSIQDFSKLFQEFLIWPMDFLETYLGQYNVSQQVSIADPQWKTFFTAVCRRFPEAKDRKVLLDFLERVSITYAEDGRPCDFLYDLLRLEVPNLFQEEWSNIEIFMDFKTFLTNYICKHTLKLDILMRMEHILVIVRDDPFQSLCLHPIYQEFCSMCEICESSTTSNRCDVLMAARKTIRDSSSRPVAQRFAWSLVRALRDRTSVCFENFDWMHSIRSELKVLGLNYKPINKDRTASSSVTAEISTQEWLNHCQWVQSIQDVLQQWKERMLQEKVNFNEIMYYASNSSIVEEVCQQFFDQQLLPPSKVTQLKEDFLQQYEKLNKILLQYSSSDLGSWCPLQTILEQFGVLLPKRTEERISEHVRFPGNHDYQTKDCQRRINPSLTESFKLAVSLNLLKGLDLNQLRELVCDLEEFLHPLSEDLDMLVFFHLRKSKLFKQYVRYHLQVVSKGAMKQSSEYELVSEEQMGKSCEHGVTIQVLSKALKCTKNLLNRITEGTATLVDVTAHSTLDIECIDIDDEFSTLSLYAPTAESCRGLEGISNLLKLLKVMRFIDVIKKTCEQYHLDECTCTRDPDFATLIDILKLKTNEAELTLQKATETMRDIRRILFLKNDDDIEKLQLFAVINDSGEFYHFIREKKFVGDDGQVRFRQQYQLITSQLQHEEYDQIVLNDLYTAFELITPFMDTLQKFHSLMQKVSRVSKTANFSPLITVNRHISLITLWFSRAEGDTVTNASVQLQSILTSGQYKLIVNRKTYVAKGDVTVNLEYDYQMPVASSAVPDSSLQVQQKHNVTSVAHSLPNFGMHMQTTHASIPIKWNSEQIADFVRRLGFLDIAGCVGDQRKHFQLLNKMAEKLVSLLLKLSELGNPKYIDDRELTLKCSELTEWKMKVSEMEGEVESWNKKVCSLHKQHKWLMFLAVPKVIVLSDQLTSSTYDAERIVKEISFMFLNKKDVRSNLRDVVQEQLGDCTGLSTSDSSLEIVGRFLDDLLDNEKIRKYALQKRSCKSQSLSEHHFHSPFTLHAALEFSQAQLIKLILTICHGFPEFYEVFNCHAMATVQNLQLFLDRAVHHQSTYILIGVNKLPYHLQEVLLNLDMELKLEQGVSTVHFIETSPSILRQVPWIELQEYKEAESLLISDDEAYQWCQDSIVNQNFSKFELVYGKAGDGKTHYIRKQLMEECKSHTTIVINEAFSLVNAICKLQSLPHDEQQCGVFFNFTMVPPGEDVDRKEQEQYVKLTESVEWFFFNLFILGYIEDQDAGVSFQFPGGLGLTSLPDSSLPSCSGGEFGDKPSMRSCLGWFIYVEVPNSDVSKTCEQTLKEFKQSFPTLSLLGTTHMVSETSQVDITKDIQLICKYMKAYYDGTIDTIFLDEEELFVLAISKGHMLVSTEDDAHLSEDSADDSDGEEATDALAGCIVARNTEEEFDVVSHLEQEVQEREAEPSRVDDVVSHPEQKVQEEPTGLDSHPEQKLLDREEETARVDDYPEQKRGEEPPSVGDVISYLYLSPISYLLRRVDKRQRKLTLRELNGECQHYTCDAVQFSTAPQLSDSECYFYLHKYMADHVIEGNKTLQMLFIRYMIQRCKFLDKFQAYMFNPGYHQEVTSQGRREFDTRQLGSTLFSAMLNEANDLCSPGAIQNWSKSTHNQLIYDEQDGGCSIGFISLNPQKLHPDFKEKLLTVGVEVPTARDIYSKKEFLHRCLARSLSMTERMAEGGYLSSVDEHEYVLTLDYALKMLSIHERYKCGVPVVIQGETGVGKTALVEMYTILMNNAVYDYWRREQSRLKEKLEGITVDMENLIVLDSLVHSVASKWKEIGKQLPPYEHQVDVNKDQSGLFQTLSNWLQHTKPGSSCSLQQLCAALAHETVNEIELSGRLKRDFLATKRIIHQPLPNSICDIDSLSEDDQLLMLRLQHEEMGMLLALEQFTEDIKKTPLSLLLVSGKYRLQDVLPTDENNTCAEKLSLLYFLLTAKVKTPFYKLNVHAAMSASEVQSSLQTWIDEAEALSSKDCRSDDIQFLPEIKVTVFLDEINTSSCLGVFKELMADRTMDGKPISDNLFIVAACNPHRGNSLAALVSTDTDETWLRSSYYVRKLHPTIQSLKWDYGALADWQETDYVKAKLLIVQKKISNQSSVNTLEDKRVPENNLKLSTLRDMIVKSQSEMRGYAYNQLIASNINRPSARLCSTCCVSQRDMQRVFTFYFWFMKLYQKYQPPGDPCDNEHRAMLVSLGLVYYMRLNNKYRKEYERMLNSCFQALPGCSSFSQVFSEQLDWFVDEVELENGIARTQALKENIFAIIACVLTTTPLILVGPPGSSKTLSFSIVISNLKGKDSKNKMFRCTELFAALDPHIYQCSRRTTSREIEVVFKQATKRQGSLIGGFPVKCVVFMDEAGLPPESHESLKVLHYHLDKQEVSFVAITNHILDAAKTNRAVSVFRPAASEEDLETLAKGCLYPNPVNAPVEAQENLKTVIKFSNAYHTLLEDSRHLKAFFGLRDFIHFINYLRRKCVQIVHPQDVMMALERNFNGTSEEDFEKICQIFLAQVDSHPAKVKQRNMLEILTASIEDHPNSGMREARYMLIIDPSEDNSAIHLLFTFGVLDWKNTRVYVCSSFPGDSDLQNINTIAGVKHSAVQGHTILMSQTDSIHESFYDLFNQRFRRIDNPDGATFFANIAIGAHTKPCCVNPKFQCVIVIKQSEVERTPAPFLNRFEKYSLTYGGLLKTLLQKLPPCISITIQFAAEKAKEFVCWNGGLASFYGIQEETRDSLVLSLLPIPGHHMKQGCKSERLSGTLEVKLLKLLLFQVETETGLQIPTIDEEELQFDATLMIRLLQKHDENFANCYHEINESNFEHYVADAVNTLVTTPAESTQNYKITQGMYAVISIFFQWLTRYFCKCLMQLMTSEALTVHHKNIPLPYIWSYLHEQHHFSLKDLIEKHFRMLKHNSKEHVNTPRMIICFTRSSSFIHQLPNTTRPNGSQSAENYSVKKTFQREEQVVGTGSIENPQEEGREEVQLKESFSSCPGQTTPGRHDIIHEEMAVAGCENPANEEGSPSVANMERDKDETTGEDIGSEGQNDDGDKVKPDVKIWPSSNLMICKLFDAISLEMVCQVLDDFVSSDTLEVLLVVVDMQHYSRSLVNHLRIMIEEAESGLSRDSTGKQFIILLHFQPVMFFDTMPCYPAFFLRGWGHYYLDSIAPSGTTGVLDIKEWFEHCYLSDKDLPPPSLKSALTDHLHRAIPIVASRALIATENVTSISGDVTELGKCKTLRRLFFEKGIGEILVSLFLAYWKPAVMRRYLEKAAEFVLSNESTLSLTDSIQTMYTSLFTDFLVYMVMKMDENYHIHTILQESCSEAIWQLFRGILKHYPIPNLPEIKQATLEEPQMAHPEQKCRFPFFDLISTEISGIINEASQCAQLKFQDSESKSVRHPIQTSAQKFDALHNIVQSRLQKLLLVKGKDYYLAVALHIMEENEELIELYCLDFYSKVLQFQPMHDEVRHLYLHMIVPKFFQADQSVTVRLISLHASTILQPMNPRNVSHILHTLDRITQVASIQPTSELYKLLSATSSSDLSVLMDIVDTLFRVLQYSCSLEEDDLRLQDWCNAYCDMVHTHPLSEHLYDIYSLPSGLCGAKLSIMQTVFLVMRPLPGCKYTSDFLQKGKTLFLRMQADYFTEDSELNSVCPQLPQLVPPALEILEGSSDGDKKIRQLIEGLLAHFFPMTHSTAMFKSSNIEWLLEHANKQFFAELDPSSSLVDELASLLLVYVSRVLSHGDAVPLKLHNAEVRNLVGAVLTTSEVTGSAYIPLFYEHCKLIQPSLQNKGLHQPLAHIYFLIVHDNLMKKGHTISGLVTIARHITDNIEKELSDCEKVLEAIEKEAVVQTILKKLADFLDPQESQKIGEIMDFESELNTVLDDQEHGEGSTSGHGLILALHMLRKQKSFHMLKVLLTDMYDGICAGIKCLQPCHESALKDVTTRMECTPEVLLELGPIFGVQPPDVVCSYQRFCTAMVTFYDHPDEVDYFIETLSERVVPGNVSGPEKLRLLRMMLWLCTYYKYYICGKPFKVLSAILNKQLLHLFENVPQAALLIQCFLDPDSLTEKPECSEDVCDDSDGIQQKRDDLYSLFTLQQQKTQNPTHLCDVVVNMVAVVLATPPFSNYLWYHLFAADKLEDVYATAFKNDPVLCPLELHCDGERSSGDEKYRCAAYLKWMATGSLNVHSVCLRHLLNFGAFCIGLLTQPEAEQHMREKIVPHSLPVRNYCTSKLQDTWRHMQSNLCMAEEEVLFLVLKCLYCFLQKSSEQHSNCLEGLQESKEWWQSAFLKSRRELKQEFQEWSKMSQDPQLASLRLLDAHYPHIPTLLEFVLCVSSQCTNEKLQLLLTFVSSIEKLKLCRQMLPQLVDFYLWLHKNLAYQVTMKRAKEITIAEVIDMVSKNHSDDTGNHLKSTYGYLKAYHSTYVSLDKLHQQALSDGTTLLQLLSYSSKDTPQMGLLWTAIEDLIDTHNNLLKCMIESRDPSYCHLFHGKVPEIHPNEYNVFTSILQDEWDQQLIPLIQSRCCPLQLANTGDPPEFNLHAIQDDIAEVYLAGKPLIHLPDTMPVLFCFGETTKLNSSHPIEGFIADHRFICEKLQEDFKEPVDDDLQKQLQFRFHSADYHTLVEVVTGLNVVAWYLLKDLDECSEERHQWLLAGTVDTFLRFLYRGSDDVFAEIGFSRLSQQQFDSLKEIKLVKVCGTMEVFLRWIKDGMYDFCDLPIRVKEQMSQSDIEAVTIIAGQLPSLLCDAKQLTEVFRHSESSITREDSQMPLKVYLKQLQCNGEVNKLAESLPETLRVHHYVAFRLVLRRLVKQAEEKCANNDKTEQPSLEMTEDNRWEEFGSELWRSKLPHLNATLEADTPFTYDPSKGEYCFQTYPWWVYPSEEGQSALAKAIESPHSSYVTQSLNVDDKSENSSQDSFSNSKGSQPPSPMKSLHNEVTTEDLLQILRAHQLHGYVELFKVNEICGANFAKPIAELDEFLSEVGVDSALDRLRITTAFENGPTIDQSTIQKVVEFLDRMNMSQYSQKFEESGIGTELLLHIDDQKLLLELVSDPLDCLKIMVLFKRYVNGASAFAQKYPLEATMKILTEIGMSRHTENFQQHQIDAECISEATHKALMTLGVQQHSEREKIKKHFVALKCALDEPN